MLGPSLRMKKKREYPPGEWLSITNKYLFTTLYTIGITITDNMDWGQHISKISSKATKTLGFLFMNLAFAPRHLGVLMKLHSKLWFGLN